MGAGLKRNLQNNMQMISRDFSALTKSLKLPYDLIKFNKSKIKGFSKNFITLVPGIFSLILGILIVLILSPITSELSKYYETVKTKYSANGKINNFRSGGGLRMTPKVALCRRMYL